MINTLHTLFVIGVLAFGHSSTQAQPAPNKLDDKGRKQGEWVKNYPEGGIMYKGRFKDDAPVGIFERYYEDSTLQAVIVHADRHRAKATLYHEGGDSIIMAKGNYIDQVRDSVWTFYGNDGRITSRETYSMGKKQGMQTIYFADGAVSEKTNFEKDYQNGEWVQYYPDGQPKLVAYVVDAVNYEGEYITYWPNGSIREKGKYQDGKKEGSWYVHNEDGAIHIIYVFRNGVVESEHPKNGLFETYYPDDIKKDEFNYKDGKKHGDFKTYYHLGEWKTEEVKDPQTGETRPVQRFYGAQVEQEGKYFEGELNGEIITYSESGKVKSKNRYVKGVLK